MNTILKLNETIKDLYNYIDDVKDEETRSELYKQLNKIDDDVTDLGILMQYVIRRLEEN